MLADLHREEVTMRLRIRFGSVAQFEREHGLPEKSVNEVLRGRTWERVRSAIEKALAEIGTESALPENSGSSEANPSAHYQKEAVR